MSKSKRRNINPTGRNETEQFVKVPYAMAQSEAWRSLSGPAIKVWFGLRTRYNGRNNGKLSLSLDKAASLLGIGKSTAHRALGELQEKGFIKLIKKGEWYGRMASEYAVTDRSYDGHYTTNDWKHWRKPKTILGPQVEHNGVLTIPCQDRRVNLCSASVPIRP